MRKNPKSDYNEENFCYECGNIITADRHFCDKQCREGYANRHKGSDVVENLKKQTKFRKRIGLPPHIIPMAALWLGRMTKATAWSV